MAEKIARELKQGDCIETPGGIFKVERTLSGLAGTVVLNGSVGGVMSLWTSYDAFQAFEVVTLH